MATTLPLNTNNSLDTNFNQVNNIIRQINGEQQTKVFKGPNNLDALTIGKLKDLGYGFSFKDTSKNIRIIGYIDSNNKPIFKVSKDGFDASTTTDDNLVFNSTQDAFKIVKKLTPTLNFNIPDTGAHQYSVTTAHGLSFTPAYLAFADLLSIGSVRTAIPSQEYSPAAYATLVPSIVKEIWVDGTNVVVQISTLGITGTKNYNFTVYLLQESAA